ncbi:MAG: Semialdehyde dehydrogenase, binding domain protein, partial [Candidatus Acidoferrum typicum]|nr:Semialdehyde dehydrogenase, binding domain protein [Candidatus Acidoferrum typicum]
MPSFERESKRIVIAGASSLLGAELKSLLEESRFASWDFRLVDEEVAAGTLTEAGGEAAVIQPVEEGTFARARLVFFTGSPEFTRRNVGAAVQSGGRII